MMNCETRFFFFSETRCGTTRAAMRVRRCDADGKNAAIDLPHAALKMTQTRTQKIRTILRVHVATRTSLMVQRSPMREC